MYSSCESQWSVNIVATVLNYKHNGASCILFINPFIIPVCSGNQGSGAREYCAPLTLASGTVSLSSCEGSQISCVSCWHLSSALSVPHWASVRPWTSCSLQPANAWPVGSGGHGSGGRGRTTEVGGAQAVLKRVCTYVRMQWVSTLE